MERFSAPLFVSAILLCLVTSSKTFAGDARLIRFQGSLAKPESDGKVQILRRFEVLLMTSPLAFFCVLDDERAGCPWPESFGRLDDNSSRPSPRLVYEYEGTPFDLPLPSLRLDLPADSKANPSWVTDRWKFEVSGSETVDGAPCLQVEATEQRGRRQSLLVDEASGLLREARQRVFMGQGDPFELSISRTLDEPMESDVAERTAVLASALLELQAAIGRQPNSQSGELSPRQTQVASEALEEIRILAGDTPLQELVARIDRDADRQQQRVARSVERQQQLLNQPAPEFSLSLVSGGTVSSESMKGKTIVLHFWKYTDKPLTEPYGQIGYLDFLAGRRKSARVEVIGVSTNPALQQQSSVAAGRRSARKLIEFMNLSYPIGYDNGSLLRALGDPREDNGDLPLWVVVSPEGSVVHYRSGLYEIDRERGLKELDDVLIKLSRSAKQAESP
ncbi:MAG: TlpA disulfide reductase family protein [Planctomycetaceae bacterium]